MVEVPSQVKQIATVLENWFQDEITSSMAGNNAKLDDVKLWQHSLTLTTDDPANTNIRKGLGHRDRLNFCTKTFAADPTNDNLLARQIFCAQTSTSGMFRNQCMLLASGQEDYVRRRVEDGPLGVSIFDSVASRWSQLNEEGKLPIFQPTDVPTVAPDELVERTYNTGDRHVRVLRLLHDIGPKHLGQENSPAVTALQEMQIGWLSLVADYVIYAAQTREDGLADVPFWEPKSISENPQIYYPFREDGITA